MQYKKTYIDAYNVLRKIPRLERLLRSNADAARRGFVEFVRKRAHNFGYVMVVFDGHGDAAGGNPNLSSVFSLSRTADSWIRENLEREKHPRMILVISSDNEIRAHALACGTAVMSAQEFVNEKRPINSEELLEQQLKNHQLSQAEIDGWKRVFETRDSEKTDDR